MEAQLADYRARKRREHMTNSTKNKILYLLGADQLSKMNLDIPDDNASLLPNGTSDEIENDNFSIRNLSKKTYIQIAGFLLWTLVFFYFVHLQWGAVFFIVSALIFVCANTRTGARRIGEMSAYSVFNRNCKTIDGTLTAEQFERELRYGPGSV